MYIVAYLYIYIYTHRCAYSDWYDIYIHICVYIYIYCMPYIYIYICKCSVTKCVSTYIYICIYIHEYVVSSTTLNIRVAHQVSLTCWGCCPAVCCLFRCHLCSKIQKQKRRRPVEVPKHNCTTSQNAPKVPCWWLIYGWHMDMVYMCVYIHIYIYVDDIWMIYGWYMDDIWLIYG